MADHDLLMHCSKRGAPKEFAGADTALALDMSAITTGKCAQIDGDTISTGHVLELRVDSDACSTGKFLMCYGGASMATETLSVAEGSKTTDILKVSCSAATAADAGAIAIAHSGAIATGGAALYVAASGTPANAASTVATLAFTGTDTNHPIVLALENLGTGTDLLLTNTNAGALGPKLKFAHDSSTPGDNDVIARLDFTSDDSGGAAATHAKVDVVMTDVSATTEDADIQFHAMAAGTLTKYLSVTGGTGPVVNAGNVKFMTSSIQANGAGTVTIGTVRPTAAATATIGGWIKILDNAGGDAYIPYWT